MDRKHNVFKDGFMLLFYYGGIKNVNINFFKKVFTLLTSLDSVAIN